MLKRFMAVILALMLVCTGVTSVFADTVLRKGARGNDVRTLQTALKELGFYSLAVDGIYGRGTVAAVRAFQIQYGLAADGVAGPKTMAKLYGTSASPAESTPSQPSQTADAGYAVLTSGSRGTRVRTLQTALKTLGYYTMSVDGVYGRGTAAAVQAFQRANGLDVTGTADSNTQQALYGGSAQGQEQPAAPAQAASDTLRLGDRGEKVTDLKTRLQYLGYYTGSLTEEFDADTRSAVLAFQKAKNLTRDGIAGKKTFAALDSAYAAARQNAGSLPDEAVSLLNAIAVDSGAVCGTLVLSKDGEVFLTWSFGGVNEDTCFRIASITKWVTAIGLMTLYDQGLLDLDRDVSEYLHFKVRNPAWPDTPITARMLLSHTSSLSPNASDYHPSWNKIGVNGYDPIFDESVEPGTQYAYADYNGALFGCLIEAITGESVQHYLDRTVFQPLKLTAAYSPSFLPAGTATRDMLDPNGKVAISVQSDRSKNYNNKADPQGNNGYTVGRLYINASSLTRLAQMMLAGGELDGVRILEEETVALMEASQPGLAASKYGLSTVRHMQFDRGTWYGHQGRYSGLSSNIFYQRETGITLALIMNGYNYKLEDNIVMPAVTLLRNMEKLETLCTGTGASGSID